MSQIVRPLPSSLPFSMRSKLFVPGSRPELFEKAMRSDADAISFDFEDSVPAGQKQQARICVSEFLRAEAAALQRRKILIVRVNDLSSQFFSDDLDTAAQAGVHLLNIPKVESADDILQAVALLAALERERGLINAIGILANIESPRGLRLAHEIAAAHPRVVGLQIGFGDLFEPLGISRKDKAAVHHLQLAVRLAAGEAGISAYDAAFTDLRDSDGYIEEARSANRLGFAGKTCVHPSQIADANREFGPNPAEIAFSHKVVVAWAEALAAGRGAITVEGRMIDAPFAMKAQTVLERAGQSSSSAH